MFNIRRQIGANIYSVIQSRNIQIEDFVDALDCSEQDAWNLFEGKVFVPPFLLRKIANYLCVDIESLIANNSNIHIPEFEYRKEFSNMENLDEILDLMDEYVECKDAVSNN